MDTKSYAELMQLARTRHAALKNEVRALEAAFPEITAPARNPQRPAKPSKYSDETRERMRQAAIRRWERKRAANGASHDEPTFAAVV